MAHWTHKLACQESVNGSMGDIIRALCEMNTVWNGVAMQNEDIIMNCEI